MRGIRKGRNQRGTGSERVKDQKGRIKEVRTREEGPCRKQGIREGTIRDERD